MASAIDEYKKLFQNLFAKLMSFALEDEFEQDLGASLELFYHMREGESYEFVPENEFLFLTWFLLDDSDLDGRSLLELFLHRHAEELTLAETQICKALQATHLSLLEVVEVNPRKSLRLRDVFLREEYEVIESEGAEPTFQGKLLFTRVMSLGETRFLVGAGVFLDPILRDDLSRFITEQYHLECENEPISFRDFLKGNGELINWWIRAFQTGQELRLDDEDDDED